MRILWHNIIAFILLIVAAVLLFKSRHQVGGAAISIKDIGPGHTTDEKTFGLLALGFLCALIVAVVKIVTSKRQ
jgi:hypothetical protein